MSTDSWTQRDLEQTERDIEDMPASLTHSLMLKRDEIQRALDAESRTKHTPEPWHTGEWANDKKPAIWGHHGIGRNRIARFDVDNHPNGTATANAARIVACVNACAGIDPSDVPATFDQLAKVQAVVRDWQVEDMDASDFISQIEAIV